MLLGDDPVNAANDDLLRAPLARQWANLIDKAEARRGLVFAITGKWGCGKTSMLRMTTDDLSDFGRSVIEFNPWLFSGTDQLVENFFDELARQLSLNENDQKKLKAAAALRKYGTLFGAAKVIPVLGTGIGGGLEAIAAYGKLEEERQRKDVYGKRKMVEEALSDLDDPIIVVLDDIDRLSGPEIRDVLRMVRLTGSFENVIYILAFDRERVELALDEDGLPGQAYLEKIVQVIFSVPDTPKVKIRELMVKALQEVLDLHEDPRFDGDLFGDVLFEVIDPLISTIRDMRRFLAPLPATILAANNEIEIVDLFALEAVRIFLPRAYSLLPKAVEALTTGRSPLSGPSGADDANLSRIKEFIASEAEYEDVLRSVCSRLFPFTQRHLGGTSYGSEWGRIWLKDRRVAAEPVLQFYLQNTMADALNGAVAAVELMDRINDHDRFEECLNKLSNKQSEEAISALEGYEGDFAEIDCTEAIGALLNAENRLDRDASFLEEAGPKITISRIVYRMLRSIQDEARTLEAVDKILATPLNLTGAQDLLSIVGYAEDSGHGLIEESAWRDREGALISRIREAGSDELATESELLSLLRDAGPPAADNRWVVPDRYLQSPKFAASLVKRSFGRYKSYTIGTRRTSSFERIRWEPLVFVLGGEERVPIVRGAAVTELGEDDEAIKLLDRYIAGWRPESP